MVLNTNHFCCSTLLKNIMLLKHFLVPWPFWQGWCVPWRWRLGTRTRWSTCHWHRPLLRAAFISNHLIALWCSHFPSRSWIWIQGSISLGINQFKWQQQTLCTVTLFNTNVCFLSKCPAIKPGTCRLSQDFWILRVSSKWKFMELSVLFASFLLSSDV